MSDYPYDDDVLEEIAQRLYDALPAMYRVPDEPPGGRGELKRLLDVLAAPLAVLRQSIQELHADLFIDTADDRIVPYLAEMVGTALVFPDAESNRRDVRGTVGWRRRKGTPGGAGGDGRRADRPVRRAAGGLEADPARAGPQPPARRIASCRRPPPRRSSPSRPPARWTRCSTPSTCAASRRPRAGATRATSRTGCTRRSRSRCGRPPLPTARSPTRTCASRSIRSACASRCARARLARRPRAVRRPHPGAALRRRARALVRRRGRLHDPRLRPAARRSPARRTPSACPSVRAAGPPARARRRHADRAASSRRAAGAGRCGSSSASRASRERRVGQPGDRTRRPSRSAASIDLDAAGVVGRADHRAAARPAACASPMLRLTPLGGAPARFFPGATLELASAGARLDRGRRRLRARARGLPARRAARRRSPPLEVRGERLLHIAADGSLYEAHGRRPGR